MQFKIYQFEIHHRHLASKRGLLLEDSKGSLSEVSPLEGRSQETLEQALEQLKALQQGWRGPLLPSVEFGLYGLSAPQVRSAPCALLLCGTPDEVLSLAHSSHGCTLAKLKVGHWSVAEARDVTEALPLRLRLDFNHRWSEKQVRELCSHLSPCQIDFLEDPGCSVSPFAEACDVDASDHLIQVWKPMVRGMPLKRRPVILSSALESSIGLHHIASLTQSHAIPAHALGLGTGAYLENDLVNNPPILKDGQLHFPLQWDLKSDRLVPC